MAKILICEPDESLAGALSEAIQRSGLTTVVVSQAEEVQQVFEREQPALVNLDLQIVGVPTVRDPDGLAMSSRNIYLDATERESARSLKNALDLAQDLVGQGERDAERIKKRIATFILGHPLTEVEYVALCDPVTLEDVETIKGETLLALAAKIRKARLIDHCIISDPTKDC